MSTTIRKVVPTGSSPFSESLPASFQTLLISRPLAHPCLIEIKISELEEEALLITISDNGTGFDIGQLEEGGIGIRNVKERLSSYSPESTMEIQSSIGNGTCTTIKLKKVTEAINS